MHTLVNYNYRYLYLCQEGYVFILFVCLFVSWITQKLLNRLLTKFDVKSGFLVTCDVVTSVPILVFLGLSVLDLGPMYATDTHQMSDAHHRLVPPTIGAVA